MSHKEQMEFFKYVKQKFSDKFENAQILEIGSLIINGTLRDIFTTSHYIGVDLASGEGVDIVCKGHELKIEESTFDATLSAECFEHDQYWVDTFAKMITLTKPDGIVAFSCATDGRPEHGTHQTDSGSSPFTLDYYKNLNEKHFKSKFNFDNLFKEYEFKVEPNHCDLYFWGIVK